MKQLKVIAPYLSVFGLFVLLSSLVAPTLASQNNVETPEWLGQGLAIAGLILLLAWPLLRFDDLREVLGTRQARYGGNALLLVVSFMAILGVLNFFGTRYFRSWDLTENKQFTISDKTVQILEGLADTGRSVQVTAILSGVGPEAQEFERLSEQYTRRHPGAQLEVLDPSIDTFAYNALAERIQETPGNRVLVAESGEAGSEAYRHALVYSGFDEQAITEAIVKATRQSDKRIVFSAGHGEYALEEVATGEARGRSYRGIKGALESEGYTVEALNFVTDAVTAIDADALMIVGPETEFRDSEIQLIEDYLSGGGALLVSLDPNVDADPKLLELLAAWGIRVNRDVALDPVRNYFGQVAVPAIVGDGYRFHTITKDLVDTDKTAVFPASRSMETVDAAVEGVTVTPLFETTSDAWGETDLTTAQAQQDPEDNPGPLILGAAAEQAGENGGRLVVLGSSQLAADGILGELQLSALFGGGVSNGDIVLNAANWLAQDDLLIGIEPTPPDSHPISLPQNPWLLFLSTVLLAPLAVAAIGFWIWWGRR